jgi:hypothetical protein
MLTIDDESLLSRGIGFCLGLGISLSVDLAHWPEINVGFQVSLISLGFIVYLATIGKWEELQLAVLSAYLLFGIALGLTFLNSNSIAIATLLMLIIFLIRYINFNGLLTYDFLPAQLAFTTLPLTVLSMFAGEVDPFEFALTTIISLYIFRNIASWKKHDLFYSLPLCLAIGASIFRENNGNIEFAGSDAAFNIGLVAAGSIAIIFMNRDRPSFQNSDGLTGHSTRDQKH